MRLSEAIALGRTLGVKHDPTIFLYEEGDGTCRGCAIGMALKATNTRYDELEEVWPWLNWLADNGVNQFRALIGAQFRQVCAGTRTLDELIDYVRSVEPPELEEAANGDRTETVAVTEPVCAKQD